MLLSTNPNCLIYLFLLAIFFISYDSLPLLSFSTYSPVSIFFIIPAYILILLNKTLVSNSGKYLIYFFIFSFIHSLLSALIYNDFYTFIQHAVTLLVMLGSFFLAEYAFSLKKYYKLYTQCFIIAFSLPLLSGCMQLLNQFGFNIGFVRLFTSFFVTRLYEVRMQMLSGEPSWAALHLLAVMPFLYFSNYKSKYKDFCLLITIILLIFSFSSYGYAVLLLSLVLFFVLNYNKKTILKSILLIISACTIVFLANAAIQYLGIDNYYSHRFDIDFYLSNNFLEKDGSMFVRLVFPYIGILEFLDFPIGYGGGFYYVNAGMYLKEFFDYGLKYDEVLFYYTNDSMKPISLYAKLLAEEGLFSIFLFYFFYLIYRKCSSKREKYVWCLAMALIFNFSSYACIDFWIILGALSGGFFREKNAGGEY